MIQDKKAVIFDLDGTLVDSMWMWHQIDVDFLAGYGLSCPEELQRKIEGMSFTETAEYFKQRFSLPESLNEIKNIWTQMSLDKYRFHVPLKKGVKEFLDYLKDRGIKTGIATSNGREIVDTVIDSLNIREYFHVITTACEVSAGKPAPDIYLKVARGLDVAPKDCLVFEDIPAGILAGKRAGMTVCAIEDHFSMELREEKESLADYFINDYYELLNGVKK